MEDRDRSRSPSRRTSRVEQVVGRWLRRSRESTSRERVLDDDGQAADGSPQEQRSCSIRVTVQISLNPDLKSHGFTITTHAPLQVQEVVAGGPADGKLLPGDQLVKINNVAIEDLSTKQAVDVIKECQDSITVTVLRITVGPKSSFITPEKRAKLKSNPFKVRFAEEVVVNGHSQGNSLLFLPNVLKVYLENGQTKAFKFEPKTTVKDIVMTLKEKLAITRIEHFTLVLEKQYSIAKLFLLHEDELIQEVVQKKESHDYRCLFRVCFMPRHLEDMLGEDPVAFEYLYLQSVSDVLQERFAVEMKCNAALRLAALHIQERLASTGQPPKTSVKAVLKEWGIESFVSNTLLRNMREKDLRKAISHHMKRILLQEPRQKVYKISANQARINYLNEMAELKSFGGKSFSATLMLQDRESMVSLLVGAKYGVSHVINHKMSIMSTLTEFSSITRVELLPESERVSLVKIYLQDIKPITLLLECAAAKDMSCLVAGYCKLFVDPQISVFHWTFESKSHRVSAEEGYVSRCTSDSEDSEAEVSLLGHLTGANQDDTKLSLANGQVIEQDEERPEAENEEEDVEDKSEKEDVREHGIVVTVNVGLDHQDETMHVNNGEILKDDAENDKEEKDLEQKENLLEPPCLIVDDAASETSDSCQTDSRFLTSMSSDSMDALEEDDFLTYFSTSRPSRLDTRDHYLHVDYRPPCPQDADINDDLGFPGDQFLCLAALSSIADCLPSPTEASDDEDYKDLIEEEEEESEEKLEASDETSESTQPFKGGCVFTFEQGDTRRYYNICSNVTPDSARLHARPASPHIVRTESKKKARKRTESAPLLVPPPGFGDSSSDDEFFDAQEKLTCPEKSAGITKESSNQSRSMKQSLSLSSIGTGAGEHVKTEERNEEKKEELLLEMKSELSRFNKRNRKRRSYMETTYTSLVSFPEKDQTKCHQIQNEHLGQNNPGQELISHFDGGPTDKSSCLTVSSLTNAEGEPAQLESKPITPSKRSGPGTHHLLHSNAIVQASQRKQQVILMEPDSMEFKSVTELMSAASPNIVAVRTSTNPKVKETNTSRKGVNAEGAVEGLDESLTSGHLFFARSSSKDGDNCLTVNLNQASLPQQDQTTASSLPANTKNQGINRLSAENSQKTQECFTQEQPTERMRSQSVSAVSGTSDPVCSSRASFHETQPQVNTTDNSRDQTFEELTSVASPVEPTQGYLLAPCSSGILGRLSAATLHGKIQSLPLYLSRSYETLASNAGNDENAKLRTFSETQSSKDEVEVSEEATEYMTKTQGAEVQMVTTVSEEVGEVIQEKALMEGEQKSKAESQNIPECPVKSSPQSVVVTTQNLNGTWGVVTSQEMSGLRGGSAHVPDHVTPGCGILTNCKSKPTNTQPQVTPGPFPDGKSDLSCSSVLSTVCETVIEGAQTPMEVCGCQSVYTNCFSGVLDSTNFDDELTVYEFSCRTQQNACDRVAVTTSIPPSSLSGSSSSFSPSSPLPSFPRVVLPPSLASELGPLLSPLDTPDCFLSDPYVDAINTLLARHYPLPPTGFMALQRDIESLLAVQDNAMKDQHNVQGHPRDTCAEHFSENKRRLHVEARGLLASCQWVVKAGQTPAETLQALAKSFHWLVQLTAVCLSFSSCQRCQERHTESLSGLADVTQTYQEFARAAERLGMAKERRTCHELSIKLLARQCTALTSSVFCLTQLFRTLTAL
ncbi:FERM and PDZ domain-containing protein 1 [Trichomycterus rosablanca]|uniref:FERM and PDZ domain-containing protein 1 n=1 Tax=Trichomycterus rosablanca TaxID=2290929 RepID=UPI002F35EF92